MSNENNAECRTKQIIFEKHYNCTVAPSSEPIVTRQSQIVILILMLTLTLTLTLNPNLSLNPKLQCAFR